MTGNAGAVAVVPALEANLVTVLPMTIFGLAKILKPGFFVAPAADQHKAFSASVALSLAKSQEDSSSRLQAEPGPWAPSTNSHTFLECDVACFHIARSLQSRGCEARRLGSVG